MLMRHPIENLHRPRFPATKFDMRNQGRSGQRFAKASNKPFLQTIL